MARADVIAFGPDGRVRATAGWTFHGAEPAGLERAAPLVATAPSRIPTGRAAILAAIAATATRHERHPALARLGMDAHAWGHLFRAMIEAESAYDPQALSPKGAYGLGQLMPATARGLGVDRTDPAQNLDGAARYLVAQMDRFGSAELALAAYNAGPHRVVEHGGIPPFAETRAYVSRVAAIYERLAGGASKPMPTTMAFTAVAPSPASAAATIADARRGVSRRSAVVLGLGGLGRMAASP